MQTRSMDSAASAPRVGPDPPASLQLQHVGLNLLRITFTDIEFDDIRPIKVYSSVPHLSMDAEVLMASSDGFQHSSHIFIFTKYTDRAVYVVIAAVKTASNILPNCKTLLYPQKSTKSLK